MIHDHIYDDDELKKENVEKRYILIPLMQAAEISRQARCPRGTLAELFSQVVSLSPATAENLVFIIII